MNFTFEESSLKEEELDTDVRKEALSYIILLST